MRPPATGAAAAARGPSAQMRRNVALRAVGEKTAEGLEEIYASIAAAQPAQEENYAYWIQSAVDAPALEAAAARCGLTLDVARGVVSYAPGFARRRSTELWYCRHGKTTGNTEPRVYQGYVDEPSNALNEIGLQQAEDAAQKLEALGLERTSRVVKAGGPYVEPATGRSIPGENFVEVLERMRGVLDDLKAEVAALPPIRRRQALVLLYGHSMCGAALGILTGNGKVVDGESFLGFDGKYIAQRRPCGYSKTRFAFRVYGPDYFLRLKQQNPALDAERRYHVHFGGAPRPRPRRAAIAASGVPFAVVQRPKPRWQEIFLSDGESRVDVAVNDENKARRAETARRRRRYVPDYVLGDGASEEFSGDLNPGGDQRRCCTARSDHAAVAALKRSLRTRVRVVDCMVDRVCTGRRIGPAGVEIDAEPWLWPGVRRDACSSSTQMRRCDQRAVEAARSARVAALLDKFGADQIARWEGVDTARRG
ncbi:Histidine phosphatase [Aureococcus anophagefferens]|nr:Histidine phosphatase [Aureococcus anophagefferens]